MAHLVNSVRTVLITVNRIQDPPPYAIYNTCYEMLGFAGGSSSASSLQLLEQYASELFTTPFKDKYWLSCAAAVSVRIQQSKVASTTLSSSSLSSSSSALFISPLDGILLKWFTEEALSSEAGGGGGDHHHNANASAAFQHYDAEGGSLLPEDVAIITSCMWAHVTASVLEATTASSSSSASASLLLPSVGEGTVAGAALAALSVTASNTKTSSSSPSASTNSSGNSMLVSSAIAVLGHIVSRLKRSSTIAGSGDIVASASLPSDADLTVARSIVAVATDSIVGVAEDATNATTATTNANATGAAASRRLVPLITRQILIPLLTGLYPRAEAAGVALNLIARTAALERHGDVVVLAASLFDCLVASGSNTVTNTTVNSATGTQCPLRSNDTIWNAIALLFESTILGGGSESQRATAQLQAVHLLQRIVSICEDEWGQNTEALKARNKQNNNTTTSTAASSSNKGGKKGGKKPPAAPSKEDSNKQAVGAAATVPSRKGIAREAFHPFFAWGEDGVYSALWNDFFLILEALNEFSLHICAQVIVKIPSLIQRSIVADGADEASLSFVIHPLFIDLLVQKGLTHANNGVRKAMLGMLWKDLVGMPRLFPLTSSSAASADADASDFFIHTILSQKTLYTVAFLTAADCRLCSELDKLVAPTAFMEFTERPEEEVPSSVIDPIAEQMCAFYKRIIVTGALHAEKARGGKKGKSNTAVVVDDNKEEKSLCPAVNASILQMLSNLSEKSPRFAVAMGMRVISAVCQHLAVRSSSSSSIAVVPTAATFDAFAHVHALALRSRHQMWMEGRAEALMVEAVLGLAVGLAKHATSKGVDAADADDAIESARVAAIRALAAIGTIADDSLDAPAVRTNSFSGTQYICDRLAAIPTANYTASPADGALLLNFLLQPASIADAASALMTSSKEVVSDLVVREIGLRIGALAVASSSSSSSVLPALHSVLSSLVNHFAALSARTCVAEETILNLCNTFRCVAGALSVQKVLALFGSSSGKGGEGEERALLAEAYEGVSTTAKRLMGGANKGGAPLLIPAFDALADVAAILLSLLLLPVSESPSAVATRHFEEWAHIFIESTQKKTNACGADASAIAARLSLRMLRAIVVGSSTAIAAVEDFTHEARPTGIAPSFALGTSSPSSIALFITLVDVLSAEEPLPMCADRRTFAALNSEIERYQFDLLFFCLSALASATATGGNNGGASFISAAVKRIAAQWAPDTVSNCSPHNLPTLYNVFALCVAELGKARRGDGDADDDDVADREAIQSDLIALMLGHSQDGLRIHAYRCTAISYSALAHSLDDAFIIATVNKVLNSEDSVARMLFFSALAVCSRVLTALNNRDHSDALATWQLFKPVLLEFALFINVAAVEDDEMVCAFAALEPAFALLPASLRARLPPTTRLVTLARVLGIVTIGECLKKLSVVSSEGGESSGLVLPFLSELLLMNVNDKRVAHTPCMPNSKTHRSRLRLWQLAHTLLPLAKDGDWDTLIPLLQSQCLPIGNIASVRRPIELMVMVGYKKRPDLVLTRLLQPLDDYDLRAQVAGAYALIAVNTGLAHIENEAIFTALYERLQRIGNSYQHLLRIIAHIGTHALLTRRKVLSLEVSKKKDDASPPPSAPFLPEHSRMLHYLSNASEVLKFLHKYQSVVIIDVDRETSADRNYCIQRMDGPHWLHEGIPAATFARLAFFEAEVPCALSLSLPLQSQQTRALLGGGGVGTKTTTSSSPPISAFAAIRMAYESLADSNMLPRAVLRKTNLVGRDHHAAHSSSSSSSNPMLDEFLDYNEVSAKLRADAIEQKEKEERAANANAAEGEDGAEDTNSKDKDGGASSDNIQRKVQSWWTSEVYNQLHPRALGAATRQSLIIVGSLLDNPVNIAGLCRCGDIFAVERVVVPNKKVFEHPHFVAAARSAELWVPWEEVAPRDLTAYLQAMKLEGYTIVGIEQTADSESMARFDFPTRAVVVLGAEGTGVPANVLPFLDVCVEIPQFGLIRSLNVHVTGAIAMYEYSVQHRMDATTRERAPIVPNTGGALGLLAATAAANQQK